MSNCSNHKKEVAGISDMEKLAADIGELHYETLAILLQNLSRKLRDDAYNDELGGRHQLAASLRSASAYVLYAYQDIHRAWQISKPFMESITPQNK